MRLLSKYVLIELFPFFIYSFLLLTFLGLLQKLIQSITLIFTRDVDFLVVVKIILYFLPSTILLTIPMSLVIAILMVFGKMSADKEIIAIKSAGINLFYIIRPVLFFAIFFSLLLIFLNVKFIPDTSYKAKKTIYKMSIESPLIAIAEDKFNRLGDILLKFEKMNPELLSFTNAHIEFISDKNKIILAKKGKISKNKNGYILIINDVSIHQLEDDGKYKIIHPIKEMIIPLEYFNSQLNSIYEKTIKMMNFYELKNFIKNFDKNNENLRLLINAKIYLTEMFVLPIACIAFAVIASPLGLISKSGKTIGFGVSLILIFIYYVLLSFSETLAFKEIFSPYYILWLPNIFLFIIGIFLIIKVIKI
ncbi:MAG TPA: LptF/LptG family permease [bacterium]|nr:LptF/LptG family permease [bacterium]HOL48183.1 LptF/LptG family permease [bacterium]HPQ19488.1 LptF/LptG family permease [bacterium]